MPPKPSVAATATKNDDKTGDSVASPPVKRPAAAPPRRQCVCKLCGCYGHFSKTCGRRNGTASSKSSRNDKKAGDLVRPLSPSLSNSKNGSQPEAGTSKRRRPSSSSSDLLEDLLQVSELEPADSPFSPPQFPLDITPVQLPPTIQPPPIHAHPDLPYRPGLLIGPSPGAPSLTLFTPPPSSPPQPQPLFSTRIPLSSALVAAPGTNIEVLPHAPALATMHSCPHTPLPGSTTVGTPEPGFQPGTAPAGPASSPAPAMASSVAPSTANAPPLRGAGATPASAASTAIPAIAHVSDASAHSPSLASVSAPPPAPPVIGVILAATLSAPPPPAAPLSDPAPVAHTGSGLSQPLPGEGENDRLARGLGQRQGRYTGMSSGDEEDINKPSSF